MIPKGHQHDGGNVQTKDTAAANDQGIRPPLRNRKSSLSESFKKLTNETFARRRTATHLTGSTSLASVSVNDSSKPRPPSKIPRSSSFFGVPTALPLQRDARHNQDTASPSTSSNRQPLRGPSTNRFVEDFPSTATQPRGNHVRSSHQRRESSTKVEERRLMQPMPPPLPHSSTMGNLGLASSFSNGSLPTPRASTEGRQPQSKIPESGNRPSIPKCSRTLSRTPAASNKSRFLRNDSQGTPPLAAARGAADQEGARRGQQRFISHSSEEKHQDRQYRDRHHFQEHRTEDTHMASETEDTQPLIEKDTKDTTSASDEAHEDSSLENPQSFRSAEENIVPDDADSSLPNANLIYTAQAESWWLGRCVALSDHYRTQALPSTSADTLPPTSPATPSTPNFSTPFIPTNSPALTPRDNPMHDPIQRNRRIFSHLRSLCATDEARESLEEFRHAWEEKWFELSLEDGGAGRRPGTGGKAKGKKPAGGKVVKEKKGWLEGLIGNVGRKFS